MLIINVIVLVLMFSKSWTQGTKTMTPDVYHEWNSIKNTEMSDDGQTIKYVLAKEVGDNVLKVYKQKVSQIHTFDRAGNSHLLPSGEWVVFTQNINYDSLRWLKRQKTPKDKMPLDTLVIFNTENKATIRIPEVIGYKAPEKLSNFIFYTQKMKETVQDSIVKKKKKYPCSDEYVVIHHLNNHREDTLFHTKDFTISRDSSRLIYSSCFGDSVATYSVFYRDLAVDSSVLLIENLAEVKNLSLSHSGDKLAFLGLQQESKRAIKPYDLYYKTQNDSLINILDVSKVKRSKSAEVSEYREITWSESGNRLFFGIQPLRPEKDTMLLDEEIVNVEIWHYDKPRHYSQLNATLDKDKKKTFGVMYDFDTQNVWAYEDKEKNKSVLSKKGDGQYILQIRNQPHQKAMVWSGEVLNDIFLLDTETGQSQLITIGESGSPKFSPEGKYVYWWSRPDSIWKALDVQTKAINFIGLWNYSKFHDEMHDLPIGADPYGIAGWLEGDTSIIVYDRYDLWELKPNNPFYYEKLSEGREKKDVYRYIHLDKENENLDSNQPWLLHKFNERSRNEAYLYYKLRDTLQSDLIAGDYWLSRNPTKSKKGTKILFTKENFQTFPDLLLADGNFKSIIQASKANPQQSEYKWGHAELMRWTNYRRQPNEGMVFYPPNFDPEKKYPLIVNFYERSSDGIHRHRAPVAHRSTINYSYYTNNDYIIFNPDISYTTGRPGDDCFVAVESGVDQLVKTGYIDTDRIALQGHSWGGYQVAYLLTKSDRYRCAESGAPVVNMISAYGGIRWETGLSRMFQYEKTQSRLGETLWGNPQLYIKNSPIFEMDKVTTPVLIMHNDADGHVPWYQGIEYFMALRRLNKPAWMLNYKDEPHWPLKWQNRLDFNIRMQEFFDHYLKDKPMPKWMKDGGSPLDTVVRTWE